MNKESIPVLEKTIFSAEGEKAVGCCADVKTTAQTPCCSVSKAEKGVEAVKETCCTPETKGQAGCC